MIGFSLGPVGRAVQDLGGGGGGGSLPLGIEYLGASASVGVTRTVATMTLPVTAQAGDIVVMATSAASSSYLSSTPSASVELATGAPRVRVVRMVGGETTVSMTHSASTGLRARALMFRPTAKTAIAVTGSFLNSSANAAIDRAVAGTPAIAIAAGTHTSTSTAVWATTLPSGFTVVENVPYSAANLRALYIAFKVLNSGETQTGGITINASGVSTVAYAGVIVPS